MRKFEALLGEEAKDIYLLLTDDQAETVDNAIQELLVTEIITEENLINWEQFDILQLLSE